jgi:hypothetical protein
VPDGLPDDELALPASRHCDSFKPSTAVEAAGSQTNFGHCSIGAAGELGIVVRLAT